MTDLEIRSLISRRQRQLLVHSYLYYVLDESIVSDTDYDRWCEELVTLQTQHRDLAQKTPYWNICQSFDASGSGYWIQRYPPEIVTTAVHLLWQHKGKPEPFDDFISRYGLRAI